MHIRKPDRLTDGHAKAHTCVHIWSHRCAHTRGLVHTSGSLEATVLTWLSGAWPGLRPSDPRSIGFLPPLHPVHLPDVCRPGSRQPARCAQCPRMSPRSAGQGGDQIAPRCLHDTTFSPRQRGARGSTRVTVSPQAGEAGRGCWAVFYAPSRRP